MILEKATNGLSLLQEGKKIHFVELEGFTLKLELHECFELFMLAWKAKIRNLKTQMNNSTRKYIYLCMYVLISHTEFLISVLAADLLIHICGDDSLI